MMSRMAFIMSMIVIMKEGKVTMQVQVMKERMQL